MERQTFDYRLLNVHFLLKFHLWSNSLDLFWSWNDFLEKNVITF